MRFFGKRGGISVYREVGRWGAGCGEAISESIYFFARIFLYVSMKRWAVCIGQRQLAFIIL